MQLLVRWKPAGTPPKRSLATYHSPLQPVPKTAMLTPGFRETKRVRVFPRGWDEEAARFRASVLAGPAAELLMLARGWQGRWEAPARALVVFTFSNGDALAQEDRDFLWDSFGVPVFEQYMGETRELLASECEAHDGLHVHREGLGRPGWMLERVKCGCGNRAARLIPAPAFTLAAGA